ncbi:ESA_00282 family adhesion-associated protein [Klebsiella sp. BIGb0407]|uniref:ESA_00282 family adhesion-associated protein n=1 Tax=Klebsiella sp. BIGb0407 TaxID=2940603 RepID=UPI00216793D7|nr:RNA helicase [Klebsiella sp. BIGb0407]MCS3431331.1 hypothetical protein [Klebsiella sp. BIGb0407]
MSTIFDVMLIVLVLLCIVLLFRGLHRNKKISDQQDDALSASNNEDHFGLLISKITPPFYWRVHNEYNDFVQATIKKMTVDEIISQSALFNAQRRCSDLNSAVYRYYENIKKRCAEGEKVSTSDIEVINLRQCFNELSCQAYPELVALIWPEYQCPEIKRENVMSMQQVLQLDAR